MQLKGGGGVHIIRADSGHIPVIEAIYGAARRFMRENGNMHQWINGYPDRAVIGEDIEKKRLYLCVDGEEILGVFCYFFDDDPTYAKIYDGEWKNADAYGVIHRIAVSPNAHGRHVASFCFDHCFEKCGNLKIDTHRDNIPMQRALAKNGFEYCGIIYLQSGDERLAYQRTEVR
ncbi:MAG: GNAT family N-acetyltransferase [Clostridia bacterium]|nr:GNAT family N-acetyltransferase [Clostridia bacterium]